MKYLLIGLVIVCANVQAEADFSEGLIDSHCNYPDAVMLERVRDQEATDRILVLHQKDNGKVAADNQAELLAKHGGANAVASRLLRDFAAPFLKTALKGTGKTPDEIFAYVDGHFLSPAFSEQQLNKLSREDLQKAYEKAHEVLKNMPIGMLHQHAYAKRFQKDKRFIPALMEGHAQATKQAAMMVVAAPLINQALDKIAAQEKAKADKKVASSPKK